MNTPLSRLALAALSICLPAAGVHADETPGHPVFWDGPVISETGWVYTNDAFLGWIWVGYEGEQEWVYSLGLDTYLYLPAHHVTENGAWAYAINLDELNLDDSLAEEYGWLYADSLGTWIYNPWYAADEATGWVYVWNYGDEAGSFRPDEVVIEATHTANLDEPDLADRFAEAYRLTSADIGLLADYDLQVTMSRGPEGITFTSNALSGNQFVRIGYHNGAGLLDLTALEGISGKVGIDVHADVDLSQTTNGFYVRLKSGENDAGTNTRLSGGVVETDQLLHSYANNSVEQGYIEVTIPWQGSVTIKDIYLYMESEVTGFADMAERITGGQGATEANTHTVTNAEELSAALTAVRENGGEPSIINVAGTITYDDWVEVTGNSARQIQPGSDVENLSIIGVGNDGVFDGIGFEIHGHNTILQNLTIREVLGRDAITVNNGTYVLIDHNTLHNEPFEVNDDKDKFDEVISIKNNAQNVIVSWNHIYDSHKTILVGSNDEEEALPDRKLIMHHNWIERAGSRVPLYRGGHAHIYNNYLHDVDSAVNARTKSKLLIENNYFEDVRRAIGYYFDDVNPSGLWEVHGNIYDGGDVDQPTDSTIDITFEEAYEYELDETEDVPAIVMAGAGAGKL